MTARPSFVPFLGLALPLGLALSLGGCREPRGLKSAGNDPVIVSLASHALECTWTSHGFADDCPAYRDWLSTAEGFRDGAGDPTLVSLLEDADARVRDLGAVKLMWWGKKVRTEAALATRLVAAAEAERSPAFELTLGLSVAKVDVQKTGLFGRIKELVVKPALPGMRDAILGQLLKNNQGSDETYDLTRSMWSDPDPHVRLTALDGLTAGGARRQGETCRLFKDGAADPDEGLAATATERLLSWGDGNCQLAFDAGLDAVEKRMKSDRPEQAVAYAKGLLGACRATKATAPQKARALGLAKGVAGGVVHAASARNLAFDAVADCDPKGWKAFVAGYLGDADPSVDAHLRAMR